MSKSKNRIVAFLLSFIMIFGLIAPFSLAAEAGSEVVEEDSLEDLQNQLETLKEDITKKEKEVKEKEEAVNSLKGLKKALKDAKKALENKTEDDNEEELNKAVEKAKKALYNTVKKDDDDEFSDELLETRLGEKETELEKVKKDAKEALEALKSDEKNLKKQIKDKEESLAKLTVKIVNNDSKTSTGSDGKAVNITAKVDGKSLEDDAITLDKGSKDVKVTFSTPLTGYRVVPKYNSATEDVGSMQGTTFTIDKVEKDTTLEFIIVKSGIEIAENVKAEHGKTNIYATLPKSAVGMKYVGYLDGEELSSPDKTVLSTGLVIFTSNKAFKLNDKIYYYLIDSNGFYSEKGLITASYKNIIKDLEEVYPGADTIKGEFDPDFSEESDLVFELYRMVNGKKEEKPVVKFEKDKLVSSAKNTYKISEDKDSFELNYKFYNFKIGEEYTLVAKQKHNSTLEDYEWKSERVFEVKDSHAIQNLKRMKGTDRFETALEIAKEVYPETTTVVLTSGLSTADALAAGPLADELNAPILLTEKSSIRTSLNAYLRSAGVTKIVIVGGEAVVSSAVETTLNTTYDVSRIKGADRFETSVKVAEELIDKHQYSKDTVLLANGMTQIDALSASRLAQVEKYPLVLTPNNQKVTSLADFFNSRQIKNVQVIGGTGAVSTATVDYYGLNVDERYSGRDRFATALDIAERGLKNEKLDSVILANGITMVDALTSASLAKKENGAILLVSPALNTGTASYGLDDTLNFIFNQSIKDVYVIGGEAAVSENVFEYLEDKKVK